LNEVYTLQRYRTSASLSVGQKPKARVTRAVVTSQCVNAVVHALIYADVVAFIDI